MPVAQNQQLYGRCKEIRLDSDKIRPRADDESGFPEGQRHPSLLLTLTPLKQRPSLLQSSDDAMPKVAQEVGHLNRSRSAGAVGVAVRL